MAVSQSRDLKNKPTGGKKRTFRDKRKDEIGREFSKTKFVNADKEKRRKVNILGNKNKVRALRVVYANVTVKGKTKKVKIKTVVENNSNREFARQNIITKGAIIDTEAGKAVVTSRPGQSGVLSAVLLTEQKAPENK